MKLKDWFDALRGGGLGQRACHNYILNIIVYRNIIEICLIWFAKFVTNWQYSICYVIIIINSINWTFYSLTFLITIHQDKSGNAFFHFKKCKSLQALKHKEPLFLNHLCTTNDYPINIDQFCWIAILLSCKFCKFC